jgi:hypothetical protein
MAIRICAPALAPALGRKCAFFALSAVALSTGACTTPYVDGAPPPPVLAQGTAIMDWTIDGAKDPARCQSTSAATFHVALYGSGGVFAGEFVQDCADFATTVGGLFPDTYTGTADLLDSSGNARTTSVQLQPFAVESDVTVTVALDFPSNSFF